MNHKVNRREFVTTLAGVPCAVWLAEASQIGGIPIIDCHIHLFDKTRPEGAPWPLDLTSPPGAVALPSRYRAIVKPFGIVGAIVVEALARIEDNQWYLDVAAADPIIVGVVGRIDCAQPDFGKHLERFRKNNLFRGIRQSRVWDALENPQFLSNLKLLADADLTLDTFISTGGSEGLLRVTDKIPSLRIVLVHLPAARLPDDRAARDSYMTALKELGNRPQVYVKLSQIVRSVNGEVSRDINLYREWLDQIWEIFGEDRLLYGSDWPNSENVELNSYPNIVNIAHAYLTGKGSPAIDKVLWRNSIPAYRWVRRDSAQPQA